MHKKKKLSPIHYSANHHEWETPQDLFDELDAEFSFDIDVCALPENAKCARFFPPAYDGLKQEWHSTCWMNPPYGKEIPKWVKKAHDSAGDKCTVVCLLPARTDTKWFHDFIWGKAEIRFIRGRIRFVEWSASDDGELQRIGAKHSAPFPSMIVIFTGQDNVD